VTIFQSNDFVERMNQILFERVTHDTI